MPLKKKLLASAKLYLILDAQVLNYGALLQVLKDSVRAGIDIVQLRDKNGSAREVLVFCREALKTTKHKIPFIVNDRVDLAIASGADGVHLGQEDLDCRLARKIMGPSKIIGVSCQDLKQVKTAEAGSADYIGFGSVFQTQTKPERQPMDFELLENVIKKAKVPIFPIGGISRRNINQLVPLGVRRVAVCRDILLAKEVVQAVKKLKIELP